MKQMTLGRPIRAMFVVLVTSSVPLTAQRRFWQ